MPFGKFKGAPLAEIPDSYILWLVDNVELREPLLSGIAVELRERGLEIGQAPATRGGSTRGQCSGFTGSWPAGTIRIVAGPTIL